METKENLEAIRSVAARLRHSSAPVLFSFARDLATTVCYVEKESTLSRKIFVQVNSQTRHTSAEISGRAGKTQRANALFE